MKTKIKKLTFIFFLLCNFNAIGQTFTQTFIDRCTGDVKIVTANFSSGSAIVSFYDKVRIFTYEEFINGTLQIWLIQQYEWWQALSPCSLNNQQSQNAQQTAQNAQDAAANAAASSASSTTTDVNVPEVEVTTTVETPTVETTTETPTTEVSTETPTTETTTTETTTETNTEVEVEVETTTETQTETTEVETETSTEVETETTTEETTTETSTEETTTEETSTETETETEEVSTEESSTEETTTEESTEETSTEESTEESSSEESTEENTEESTEENSEESSEESNEESNEEESTEETEEESTEEESDESTEEESEEETDEEESTEEEESEEEESDEEESEEESDDEDSEEEEEEKRKSRMLPIILKADAMAMQSVSGRYNGVLMVGMSQTSLFGDRSYGITGMLYDNLKQWGISSNTSKVTMTEDYKVAWIDGLSLSYMRNFKANSIGISASRMKPLGKWGTVGVGFNGSNMWMKDMDGIKSNIMSFSYNILYTNSFKVNEKINYAPALIFAQSPISYLNNRKFGLTSRDQIYILSNSYTLKLTKVFSVNLNWTIIASTNEFMPIMNSFMIGSKIPL